MFFVHARHADDGTDRTSLGESGDNGELLFWLEDIHGTSSDRGPRRRILSNTSLGVIGLFFTGLQVTVAQCYTHWAANVKTMVPGVSFELTTYGLAVASLSPFELPRHSSLFKSFQLINIS